MDWLRRNRTGVTGATIALVLIAFAYLSSGGLTSPVLMARFAPAPTPVPYVFVIDGSPTTHVAITWQERNFFSGNMQPQRIENVMVPYQIETSASPGQMLTVTVEKLNGEGDVTCGIYQNIKSNPLMADHQESVARCSLRAP